MLFSLVAEPLRHSKASSRSASVLDPRCPARFSFVDPKSIELQPVEFSGDHRNYPSPLSVLPFDRSRNPCVLCQWPDIRHSVRETTSQSKTFSPPLQSFPRREALASPQQPGRCPLYPQLAKRTSTKCQGRAARPR